MVVVEVVNGSTSTRNGDGTCTRGSGSGGGGGSDSGSGRSSGSHTTNADAAGCDCDREQSIGMAATTVNDFDEENSSNNNCNNNNNNNNISSRPLSSSSSVSSSFHRPTLQIDNVVVVQDGDGGEKDADNNNNNNNGCTSNVTSRSTNNDHRIVGGSNVGIGNKHSNKSDDRSNNRRFAAGSTDSSTQYSRRASTRTSSSSVVSGNTSSTTTSTAASGGGGGGSGSGQKSFHEKEDLVGAYMANILNNDPTFTSTSSSRDGTGRRRRRRRDSVQEQEVTVDKQPQYQHGQDDQEDLSSHSESFFYPLLSAKNYQRCVLLFNCIWIVAKNIRPHRDVPDFIRYIYQQYQKPAEMKIGRSTKMSGSSGKRRETTRTAGNNQAATGGCIEEIGVRNVFFFEVFHFGMICCVWMLVFMCVAAGALAFTAAKAVQFCYVVTMMGSVVLVDWKEIISIFPPWIQSIVPFLSDRIRWFDLVVLQGKRYIGREWNKDGFEFIHPAKSASSGAKNGRIKSKSLWKNPPPCIQQVGLQESIKPQKIQRPEWSPDTTQHVAAIDFCYLMVRDDFVSRQYSKLRASVFKKKAGRINATDSDEMFPTRKEVVAIAPGQEILVVSPDQSTSLSTEVMLEQVSSYPGEDHGFVQQMSHDGPTVDPIIGSIPTSRNTLKDVERIGFGLRGEPSARQSLRLDEIFEGTSFEGTLEDGSSDNHHHRGNSDDSGSDAPNDMNWMDVGAEIGIKILGSAAVQKAVASQDTVETISTLKERVESHIKSKALSGNMKSQRQLRRHSSLDDRLLVSTNDGLGEDRDCKSDLPKAIVSHPVNPMWTSASNAVSPVHSPHAVGSEITAGNPSEDRLALPEISLSSKALSATKDIKCPPCDTFNQDEGKLTTTPAIANMSQSDFVRNSISPGVDLDPAKTTSNFCQGDFVEVSKRPENKLSTANRLNANPPAFKRRKLILPGTKIVVPLLPYQPGIPKPPQHLLKSRFQMGTVVSSRRICVYKKNKLPLPGKRGTNCLSITVKLDKSFLRNGEFATMTMRIMDEWGDRYMPKHSKLPVGSCVATTFGLGVLVGWRVEDDCHIVRSLWQRRGPGSALAYLRRDSIHATMEASSGFEVDTKFGHGTISGYINGGCDFRHGRYLVSISEKGRYRGQLLELERGEVLSCKSAQFIPVIEQIRAAAQYQLQIDFYEEAVKTDTEDLNDIWGESKIWGKMSKNLSTLWSSFLRAIDEDEGFDEGMNEFVQSCVSFLERLDSPDGPFLDSKGQDFESYVITTTESSYSSQKTISTKSNDNDRSDSGLWLMNNMFGIFGVQNETSELAGGELGDSDIAIEVQCAPPRVSSIDKQYERAFAVLRTLMRTVTIAQATCTDEPDFKLGLSLCYEFLLFIKTIIKVQRKNMNHQSLQIWREAWSEIISVFGPVIDRLNRIAQGIAERMEKQGRRAKVRVLRFVDIVVSDDSLMFHLEHGDWESCAKLVEDALVRAKIIDQASREHYHKTAQFLYDHFSSAVHHNNDAKDRNNKKLANFLLAVQWLASPRKAILKLFLRDGVLDAIERIFVRVFDGEEVASRMLTIHSSNFQTLRQFRLLKNFTISAKVWIPLLDAADEEISSLVSTLPDSAKDYLFPLSSLFSLCVSQFHKISQGDLTKDWLDFLMEDAAADIIHEIDMKLILALQSFSRDVKEMMVVLPYYPSIDVDILNLVDELDIDEFVKEASVALEDEYKLHAFLHEKAMVALERFLDYIPKVSIPVEKRDLGDGWTLTCRGADGGDLRLTEMTIKRENLRCQVMGGDTLFFPTEVGSSLSDDDEEAEKANPSDASSFSDENNPRNANHPLEETSILDHIREMILNAQKYGCWKPGDGGIYHPPSDKYAAAALHNLPVSAVLDCGINLWRNLEIDDDELLEIAVRDVSYQIETNEEEDGNGNMAREPQNDDASIKADADKPSRRHHRFNPRVDPTVLYLEIKKLTFNLENFLFRIEKHENKRTIFDPTFDGSGSVLVRNVSVRMRIECVKDYVRSKSSGSGEICVPLLQLQDFDVSLEQVKLQVKNTGADWLLNKVVEGFGDRFTDIMTANLQEQIQVQIEEVLKNLNDYFVTSPEVLLTVLDISLDDLEEKVIYV